MTAFLAWQAAHGREVEEGRQPAEREPPIDGDDVVAWNFYCRNATMFVKDFGLMESRIRALRLSGTAAEMFNRKLDLIHEKIGEMNIQKAQKIIASMSAGTGKDILMAEDPT